MHDTILFDLDGTLTDPREGITRCIQHGLQELGHPAPPADELLWCIGPSLKGSFEKLLGDDADKAAEGVRLYRERFSTIGMFENQVYDGVEEMLKVLTQAGKRLILATAKPHVYAIPILEHFGLDSFFDCMYGSELNGRFTDKTELIAHILDDADLKPGTALMVGDRGLDIIGAHSNALKAIAVLYGYGTREELAETDPDYYADVPADISRLII